MSRGSRENSRDSGCMRARMTESWRSLVRPDRRCIGALTASSSCLRVSSSSWLRVKTSSETSTMMRSSDITSTRMVSDRFCLSPPSAGLSGSAGVTMGAMAGRCGAGVGATSVAGSTRWPSRAMMRSSSSPDGSTPRASSSLKMSLTRSTAERISVTSSGVADLPSRNRQTTASAACVRASSRPSPRKPQVPLMVWTRRKMLPTIAELDGSVSN